MEEFRQNIMQKCAFLFSSNPFQIIDSDSSESFGNAFLILERGDLRLQFVKDRNQIFLDFQPSSKKGKLNWYSIDVVKQMITGKIESSAEIIPRNIEFLKTNLDKIEHLFSKIYVEDTIKKLKKLERERAKRLFP